MAAGKGHVGRVKTNPPPSPLDDPTNAAFAWNKYRRMMQIVGGVTVVVVIASLVGLSLTVEDASIHFYIATGLGVAFTMLLAGALMGLMFLSNGTGHDAAVSDPFDGEEWPGKRD